MLDNLGITWIYALLVVISYLDSARGYELPKWNMSQHCGETIGKGYFAGGLIFDAASLPVKGDSEFDECIVTVEPSATEDDSSRVLFYFTSFDILNFCEDTNVTIINGDSRGLLYRQHLYPIPVDRVVTGLATTMCGTNSTLLQRYQTFYPSTSPGVFTVVFRRNDYARQYSGNFTIKFASYKEGICPRNNDYHNCSNDRCITSDISCEDEIDACGAQDAYCDYLEALKYLASEILKYIGQFVIIIMIVIAVVITFKCFQHHRRQHAGCGDCIRRLLYRLCDTCSCHCDCDCNCDFTIFKEARDSIRSRIFGPPVSEQPTGMTSQSSEADDNRNRDSLSSEVSTESTEWETELNYGRHIPPTNPTDAAPSYDSLFPDGPPAPSASPPSKYPPSEPSSSLPPPPAYNDVIRNEDAYRGRDTNV